MESTRFGPYLLHQQLNSGGMSEVFLATDPHGKTIALRRMNPDKKFNPFARRKFVRAARIHAQMNHPCVVKVYEVAGFHWLPYFTTEYHEGVNLRQALGKKQEYLRDLISVFVQMLEALNHVHSKGWMHMDYKPENLHLGYDGSVRLFDFDLARPIPKGPKIFHNISGTPSYLAPEQILREPVDERADIFALGITAYELFTRQKPFSSPNSQDIFRNYTNFHHPFRSPHQINASITPGLSTILTRCIEKRVERRYSSVALIIQELAALEVKTLRPFSPTGIL